MIPFESPQRTAELWAARLPADPRFANDLITCPHPFFVLVCRTKRLVVLTSAALWDHGRSLLEAFRPRFEDATALVVLIGRPGQALDAASNQGLFCCIPSDASLDEAHLAIERAFELMGAQDRAESRGQLLRRSRYELGELVNIARTMTTERDVRKLLSVILEKSRYITGADAGSIYVVDGDRLRFMLTQNDSASFDSQEFVMPLSNRSIAGSSALRRCVINLPDVYALAASSPFGFDRSFDDKTGYRTKSMLVAPLISQRDEVIGVLQLINKKRDPQKKLLGSEDMDAQVITFDQRSVELVGTVAAQAGVSLETAMLYDEIRQLFEGFVLASVEAIESRDPTTSGHSRRVADLTRALALAVHAETTGPYRDVHFSELDLRELQYASLLHDFGKIGVREKVLVKANKLYDERLALLRLRFDFVARSIEADLLARKVAALQRGTSLSALDAVEAEHVRRVGELEQAFAAVLHANEPTVLRDGDFERIESLASETYVDLRGLERPLLDEEDVISLTVKQGSLTPAEAEEIRSHVAHTYRFLSRIPWGQTLRRVPLFASAHHERPNGTGYPNRWHAQEIPLQSKIMAVADVFDALVATDRPYKRAVPIERALDILNYNVRDGNLDAELVRVFCDARVWERAC
ncbi:MAG: HD domain-containing phosphohydrolase [Myxococcales bacterium]